MKSLRLFQAFALFLLVFPLKGCLSMTDKYRNLTVQNLDIERFMGKWYVIASIPTIFEKNATNAVETYTLKKDGTIHVDFIYNKKSPEGKLKTMTQTAYVVDEVTRAHWKIRPFWPLLFDYLVLDVEPENYSYTIIGRPGKQNLWIMARTPEIPEALYEDLLRKSVEAGYEKEKILKVPQIWNK